jgi:2-polyprenyl-6-methoxyphenol hydroxylase-like FAD-dependent oxidoreductase
MGFWWRICNAATRIDFRVPYFSTARSLGGRQRHERAFSATSQPAPPPPPPIVIVGGGPVGLWLALLLSEFRVPSVLIEAQTASERFRHPQAHFLNTRTMEILRHCVPPTIHERIVAAMPPSHQWDSFRFGASLLAPPLAIVRHPVRRPLQLNQDANGILLPIDAESNPNGEEIVETADLSTCTVGHLAQHTFGRILFEEACLRTDMIALHYGTQVDKLQFAPRESDHLFHVVMTSPSQPAVMLGTNLCLAADGAHSSLRKQFNIGTSPTKLSEDSSKIDEKSVLQHLINIHVQILPVESAAALHKNNHAMLYSVYSPTVVAMVVCHSVGEYIIQIPYFPPYQTVHDNFGPDQVARILQAIFGPRYAKDCVVQSVKPWTMTSFVADRYYSYTTGEANGKAGAMVLVGDAAHVFPPAGGFGMNTGLQDAHNIAWKLAAYYHNNQMATPNENATRLARLLQSYESERRPIAEQNAVLSVRNYRRLLKVVESLYLYEQHPAMLQSVLDQSSSILPLSVRQTMFRSLLQTALYPLSWLHDMNNPYTQYIRANLRRVLQTGAGLPLLFPKFEIGMTYGQNRGEPCRESTNEWHQDTIPLVPRLEVGRLVPHVAVEVAHGGEHYCRLQPMTMSTPSGAAVTISTSDLPSQMRTGLLPSFVLLWVVRCELGYGAHLQAVLQDLCRDLGLPAQLAILYDAGRRRMDRHYLGLRLVESSERLQSFSFFSKDESSNSYAVLIRPDGYIAAIETAVRATAQEEINVSHLANCILKKCGPTTGL